MNKIVAVKTITHRHPNPEQWANYLAICGIDKGVFSEVTKLARCVMVRFENGYVIRVVKGKLQPKYAV